MNSQREPQPLRVWRDSAAVWNEWARASLLERRMVLLDGTLDDDTANRVATELMLLDADGDEPVAVRIDSAGGSSTAALTVIDVIDLLGVPVHATCVGRAIGPAFAVLAVAAHRAAAPHAQLRLGDETPGREGRARDVLEFAEQYAQQLAQLTRRLAAASAVDVDTVGEMLRDGARLSVDDALRLGFIDEIATAEARVLRFPRRVGYRRE